MSIVRVLPLIAFGLFAVAGCAAPTDDASSSPAAAAGDEEDVISGPYQEKVSDQLTRSSQPDAKWIKSLADRGFRSVVNLRAEDNSEAAEVKKDGMTAHHIPVVDHELPTLDQVKDFLDFVTRKENQPADVHCNAGKGRTGMFVASYRVAVQGWTAKDALAEGVSKGMNASKGAMLDQIEQGIKDGTFPKYEPVR